MLGDGDGDALMLGVLIQLIDINTVSSSSSAFHVKQKDVFEAPLCSLIKKKIKPHTKTG